MKPTILNTDDIKIDESKNEEIANSILNGLRAYSAPYLGSGKSQPFSLYIVDDETNVIAGILGATRPYLNSKITWVHKVWVEKIYRGRGLGRSLFAHLDNFAYKKGCAAIQLEIFDFQNKTFYEKQGFQSIGVISNALRGKDKFFMRKTPCLAPTPMNLFPIFLNESENENIKQVILDGYNVFNKPYLGESGSEKDFSIYLQDINLKIIAGITGRMNNHQAWAHVIWVDEMYRGQGIGKILWKKLEDYIRNKDYPHLFLGTLDSFGTKPFYEKVGCRCQGTIPKWVDGHDQHWFEKKLIHVE